MGEDKENIFKSLLDLTYLNERMELIYSKFISSKIYSNNCKYNLILLILSITINLIILNNDRLITLFPDHLMKIITTHLMFFIQLLLFILSLLRNKRYLQSVTILTNYSLITIYISLIDYVLIVLNIKFSNFEFILEMCLKNIIILYDLIEFKQSVIINLISIIVYFLFNFQIFFQEHQFIKLIAYILNNIVITLISYTIIKYKRTIIHSKQQYIERNIRHQHIYKTMRTAFIKIKNGKVGYVNKAFVDYFTEFTEGIYLNKHKKIDPFNAPDSIYEHKFDVYHRILEYSDHILYKLFINNEYSYQDSIIDNKVLVNEINKYLNELETNYKPKILDSFVNIDSKEFTIVFNNINIIFEMHFRFYVDIYDKSKCFEFVINDITSSKLSSNHNYQIVRLSKITHEFKNPLICINELIDTFEESKRKNNNNIKIIKSVSDYLLILVKNLDYLSIACMHKNIELTISKVDLRDICEFCRNISFGLITRYNKINSVVFIETHNFTDNVTLHTDEIKLKQILVNLISNAIKFTNHGYVKLCVNQINDVLEFCIEDTGIGMNNFQTNNLFKSYYKLNNHHNKYGSGLGLSITNDLVHDLGSSIHFKTELGRGTKFWFNIKCTITVNGTSKRSLNNKLLNLNNYSNNYRQEFNSRNISFESKDTRMINYNITLPNNFYNNDDIDKSIKSTEENLLCPIILNREIRYEAKWDILIVDDDYLVRQSNIRILNKTANELNIDINILEAEDGIETLFVIYKYYSEGKTISYIISDENMGYLDGSESLRILSSIFNKKDYKSIPFTIISALENKNEDNTNLETMTKPLDRTKSEKILNSLYITS